MDNHQRFLGGVWTGVGLTLLWCTRDPAKRRNALNVLFFLVFVGGCARFSQRDPRVMMHPEVLWAAVVELVGMPLLFLWLNRWSAR